MLPNASKKHGTVFPCLGLVFFMVFGLVFGLVPTPAGAAGTFADPAMQGVWNRTDLPIEQLKTSRTWLWGPSGFETKQEPYAEAPGGMRTVEYFDKSRMEVNNPNGDRSSQWFITNGLLSKELITGQVQTGDNSFESRYSAVIPVAGDPDDTNGPTYATLSKVLGPYAERKAAVMETIDRDGNLGVNGALGNFTDYVYFVPETGHNIPRVFWDFLNSNGLINQNGKDVQGRLFDPTFFATGFPITEAYWAKVKVAGQEKDVLVQAYERRVLTYTPTNSEGWQVEMGNVGRHYYDWRYNNAGMPSTSPVTPSPSQPDPGADIPADVSGSISPKYGPSGTVFIVSATGFDRREQVGYFLSGPHGAIPGNNTVLNATWNGDIMNMAMPTGADTEQGLYSFTFRGLKSGHEVVAYFRVVSKDQLPVTDPNSPLPQGWTTFYDEFEGYKIGLPSGWKSFQPNSTEMEEFLALQQQSNGDFASYLRSLAKLGGFINKYKGEMLGGAYNTAPNARSASSGIIPAFEIYRNDLGKKATIDEWAQIVIYQIEDRFEVTGQITQERIVTPSGDLVILKCERTWQSGQGNVVNTEVLGVSGNYGYLIECFSSADQETEYGPLFAQMARAIQLPPSN